MMIYYFIAILISLIYVLVKESYFVLSVPEITGLIWIGVFTNAIAFTTWALALSKGDTAKISDPAYITPFLSLVWTSLVLKEKLSIYSVSGLIVIVSGIFIQLRRKNNEDIKN